MYNLEERRLKRITQGQTGFKVTLSVAILMLFASPVIAGYLNVINPDRLPIETVGMLSELRKLEPYVEEWQPIWSHDRTKDEIKARIGELYRKSEDLIARNKENGELLLLCGLIAYYGHNVDLDKSSERADAHFASAQKVLANDYRPLWLLGIHLVKSTRCAEGMKALLEAERKQSIREPLFWENYAMAAYFTSMYSHALQALERVRELSGKKSKLDNIIGDKMRAAAKTPKPGDKLQAQDLWRSTEGDTAIKIISFPLGYKFSVKKKEERNFQTTGFDGRFAALKVRLTPRIGAEGVRFFPTLQIITFVAEGKEMLENFAKRFLSKSAKWQSYDLNLGLGELAYIGESSDHYKAGGGAKVVMIAFERSSPKISRFAIEEPEEELKGANPGFYRLTDYYQRFEGRLFYQIWLETPARFFDDSLAEFKDILKTFIVE